MKTTEDSAGYDLFATETKTFLPKKGHTLSIDLRYWFHQLVFMENYFHAL